MEKLIDICKSPETGINIWFIINCIRPAYWLDSYKIQSKKKMDELLDELKNTSSSDTSFYKNTRKKIQNMDHIFQRGL